MEILPLCIHKQPDASLVFRLKLPGKSNLPGETREYTTEPATAEMVQDTTPKEHLRKLMPAELCVALRQWELAHQENPTLAITEYPKPSNIRWEMIPAIAGLDSVMIVRVGMPSEGENNVSVPGGKCSLLAAGWADWGVGRLPGVEQELSDIPRLERLGSVEVSALIDVSIDEFSKTYRSVRPQLLHLASVTAVGTKLCMGKTGTDPLMIDVEELAAHLLVDNFAPMVVMLNCCDTDQLAAALHARLPSTTVGWVGLIDDRTAGDFAAAFYARLLDGFTVVDAVRSFDWKLLGPSALPVIWYPSLEHIENRPIKNIHDSVEIKSESGSSEELFADSYAITDRLVLPDVQLDSGDCTASERPATNNSVLAIDRKIELEAYIKMKLVAAINPALLTNGKPVFEHLAIFVSQPVNDACFTLSCDTGQQTSLVTHTHKLKKGLLSIAFKDIQFPALYELIDAKVGRRRINITATLEVEGRAIVQATEAVLWMACDEWMDQEATWSYVPAFVQPHSTGVHNVLDDAAKNLETIASPTSAFDGYQTNDADHVMRQVEAMFITLRENTKVKYINPPGSPVFITGDTDGKRQPQGQKVRLCDEVIEYKRGTCHDLALVFASLLEHVGIYPLVILVKGHTFFGFWTDANTHVEYWRNYIADPLKRPAGDDKFWVISDRSEILALLNDNSLCLVESTFVTNRNATFEEAIVEARKHVDAFDARNNMEAFDCAIDIAQSRCEVQPMG